MKIVILLLFIILIFLINKNIFDIEPYQDYGNTEDTRGPPGLSIERAEINDSGYLVFVLSNNSRITTTKSVLGAKGATGNAGVSIDKDNINYDESSGELSITLSNGDVKNLGRIKGNQGVSQSGVQGEPGVGIKKIDVNQASGDLIVTLDNDDETQINAGNVRGERGEDCKNIPQGIIVAWAGSKTNIPGGWAVCNGTNGTPDLRARFIIGSNSNYEPGEIGGEMTHKLELEEIPNHKHKTPNTTNIKVDKIEANTNTLNEAVLSVDKSVTDNTGDIIGYSGDVKPHNNMPPYFALIFIMKT